MTSGRKGQSRRRCRLIPVGREGWCGRWWGRGGWGCWGDRSLKREGGVMVTFTVGEELAFTLGGDGHVPLFWTQRGDRRWAGDYWWCHGWGRGWQQPVGVFGGRNQSRKKGVDDFCEKWGNGCEIVLDQSDSPQVFNCSVAPLNWNNFKLWFLFFFLPKCDPHAHCTHSGWNIRCATIFLVSPQSRSVRGLSGERRQTQEVQRHFIIINCVDIQRTAFLTRIRPPLSSSSWHLLLYDFSHPSR